MLPTGHVAPTYHPPEQPPSKPLRRPPDVRLAAHNRRPAPLTQPRPQARMRPAPPLGRPFAPSSLHARPNRSAHPAGHPPTTKRRGSTGRTWGHVPKCGPLRPAFPHFQQTRLGIDRAEPLLRRGSANKRDLTTQAPASSPSTPPGSLAAPLRRWVSPLGLNPPPSFHSRSPLGRHAQH